MRATFLFAAFFFASIWPLSTLAAVRPKLNSSLTKRNSGNDLFKISTQSDESGIEFHLEVKNNSKGWIAIGVCAKPGMEGADMAVITFESSSDSKGSIQDMHSPKYGKPEAFYTHNWQVEKGEVIGVGTRRIVVFRHYKSPNKRTGGITITKKKLYIIWARDNTGNGFLSHGLGKKDRGFIAPADVLSTRNGCRESIQSIISYRIKILVFVFLTLQTFSVFT